jgi:hypothetical protein
MSNMIVDQSAAEGLLPDMVAGVRNPNQKRLRIR